MKYCPKCSTKKSVVDFHKNRRSPDGLQSWCKDCRSTAVKGRYKDRRTAYNQSEAVKSKARARASAWYRENKERARMVQKQYRQTSEIYKKCRVVAEQRRRERKRNLKEVYTTEDYNYTMKLFSSLCFKCKSSKDLTIDHHIPLCRGGMLTRDNAVVLCRRCNASKGSLLPEEFYSKEELKALGGLL